MHPPQGNSQHAQPEAAGGGPNATGGPQAEGEDDQDDKRRVQPRSPSQHQVTRTQAVDEGASAAARAADASEDPASHDPAGWLATAKAAFSRYVEDQQAMRRLQGSRRLLKTRRSPRFFLLFTPHNLCFQTRQFLSMCVLSICPTIVKPADARYRCSKVHLMWYLVAPLIASAILYGIDQRDSPYVDLLFLAVSALTVTGACLPRYLVSISRLPVQLLQNDPSDPHIRSAPQVSIRY